MPDVTVSPDTLAARWAELWRRVAGDGFEAIVVLGAPACLGPSADSPGSLRLLTGWMSPFAPAALVARPDERPVVLAIGPHDARGFRARLGDAATVRQVSGPDALASAVADLVGTARAGALGVAGLTEASAGLADALRRRVGEPRPVEEHLYAMRVRRYDEFADLARRVAAVSDAMVERVFDAAAEGRRTGAELMALAERVGRSGGAEFAGCWIAIGARPATTYFEPWELSAPLRDGDRLQIGTTVRYLGCYGQSLRTAVRGQPAPALVEHHARLLAIQDEIAASLRPGVALADVAGHMAELVEKACPYPAGQDPFRFQFCHGLGLSYSEPAMRGISGVGQADPRFADAVLTEGMVVEIHPNYSVPDLGHVCAGDMAQVTPTGAVWLTSSARGLRRLERSPD
jgi:Xaa-Pro aminopeptidase